jgi:hypothetical protein
MNRETKRYFQGNHLFKLCRREQACLLFPWLFYHLRDCIREHLIVTDEKFDIEDNKILQCYTHRNRFYKIGSSNDANLIQRDLDGMKIGKVPILLLLLTEELTGPFKKYYHLSHTASKVITWSSFSLPSQERVSNE